MNEDTPQQYRLTSLESRVADIIEWMKTSTELSEMHDKKLNSLSLEIIEIRARIMLPR